MEPNDKMISLSEFLSKEIKIIFNVLVLLGLAGHILDIFTLLDTRPYILTKNLIACLIMLSTYVLYKTEFIRLNLAFSIVLYTIFFNIMSGFYTFGNQVDNFQLIFLRNTIFASFILSVVTLFCNRKHAFIIVAFFFIFSVPFYIVHDFELMKEIGIMVNVIFVCFAVVMYFFRTKLQMAIVKITNDRGLIIHKNKELKKLLDKVKAEAKLIKEKNEIINRKNTQLIVQEQKLKDVNATKDKFFSIVAHDLKSPLNAINVLTEILYDHYDSFEKDKQLQYISQINETGKNLYKLLENLLIWSRSQTGSIEFRPQDMYLYEVLTPVIQLFKSQALSKNIKIKYNANKTDAVYADKEMVKTILRNLISNAIKFTPVNGIISINTAKISSDKIKITVNDSGIGIKEELLPNLFKPDKSISQKGTEGESGTGLGLLLCKEFVVMNNGNIGVKSTEGEGALFWFTLKTRKALISGHSPCIGCEN